VPERITVGLRISLAGASPPIWREVSVPASYTLEQLHRVIQMLFTWFDYHLYEFTIGRKRYQRPDPEMEGESSEAVTLDSLGLSPQSRFSYVYDFGDEWLHELSVFSVEPIPIDSPLAHLPHVLAGEGAAPRDDSGGIRAWNDRISALTNPAHPDHADALEVLPITFDPTYCDLETIQHGLQLAAAWGAI